VIGVLFSVTGLAGILGRMPLDGKIALAGNVAALTLVSLVVFWFDRRYKRVEHEAAQEMAALGEQVQHAAQEKARLNQSLQSLTTRTRLQHNMENIVRRLTGTREPDTIKTTMMEVLSEAIPHGARQIVSDFTDLDAADAWVMKQRVPILSQDISRDGRFIGQPMHGGAQSVIVAPVVVMGHVRHIIRMESTDKDAFDLADLRMAELISLMVSASLGNAELYTMIETKALTDGLTGLFTQNYFIEKLQQETFFAIRYKSPMALFMIDVDHFKKINDTYGHPAGDAVLRGIAAIIRQAADPTGTAARYGGEEFAVILPKTDRAAAHDAAMHILNTTAQTLFAIDGGSPIQVTVSIGLSVLPDDGNQGNQLISAADARLYQAKANGRNQVVA
jgi:diguanylate cyclase (GGDEF)-like protein